MVASTSRRFPAAMCSRTVASRRARRSGGVEAGVSVDVERPGERSWSGATRAASARHAATPPTRSVARWTPRRRRDCAARDGSSPRGRRRRAVVEAPRRRHRGSPGRIDRPFKDGPRACTDPGMTPKSGPDRCGGGCPARPVFRSDDQLVTAAARHAAAAPPAAPQTRSFTVAPGASRQINRHVVTRPGHDGLTNSRRRHRASRTARRRPAQLVVADQPGPARLEQAAGGRSSPGSRYAGQACGRYEQIIGRRGEEAGAFAAVGHDQNTSTT